MWHGLRISPTANPDFIAATTDLVESVLRILILAIAGICLAWYIVVNSTVTVPISSLVLLVVGVVTTLALRLLPKQIVAAQWVWLVGLMAAVALATYLFQQPEIAFFYMLLPFLAAAVTGWPAGLLAEGLVIGLVWWFSQGWLMPPLPASYGPVIIIGGAAAGTLGWAATYALLTVARWAFDGFEQARREMARARDQRLELKQVQEDLIQANRELARLSDRLKAMYQVAEEARRAKEEFVANVSHELRTPLNMIIGFSEMIPKLSQVYGIKLPPALLSDIEVIRRNSQHLAKLVDDVLDLSQVESGRMALSKEWASVQEIVDEAVVAVRPLYESKGLYLETEVPSDLPSIFCDSTRIRQVILNLLSNAGRFTERGGVRVSAWTKDRELVVSVADTGPGITPEDQKRIFQPFQQVDGSIRRRHGGSGLGLSISKRFVEMHGGKMWLESTVDVGTTFYFSLPLDMPLLPEPSPDSTSRWFNPYDEVEYRLRTRPSKALAPKPIPRFLLLEEGDGLKRLFGRYLNDVEVLSVPTIQQAIEALSRSPAQALVVNASSPAEVIKECLADLPYGTPVVACWIPSAKEAARRLGVVHYLVKPIAHETLLAALADLGEGVKNVLLVDDEPEALQLFTRMLALAPQSYRVLQAKNGRRALELLRQRHPDVMLLDLIMPGMDGFQVLQEKSQDPSIRDIPVILISARDPSGEPIVSDLLTVTRGGGLSVRELLACVRSVSEILAPPARPVDQGSPETPAA